MRADVFDASGRSAESSAGQPWKATGGTWDPATGRTWIPPPGGPGIPPPGSPPGGRPPRTGRPAGIGPGTPIMARTPPVSPALAAIASASIHGRTDRIATRPSAMSSCSSALRPAVRTADSNVPTAFAETSASAISDASSRTWSPASTATEAQHTSPAHELSASRITAAASASPRMARRAGASKLSSHASRSRAAAAMRAAPTGRCPDASSQAMPPASSAAAPARNKGEGTSLSEGVRRRVMRIGRSFDTACRPSTSPVRSTASRTSLNEWCGSTRTARAKRPSGNDAPSASVAPVPASPTRMRIDRPGGRPPFNRNQPSMCREGSLMVSSGAKERFGAKPSYQAWQFPPGRGVHHRHDGQSYPCHHIIRVRTAAAQPVPITWPVAFIISKVALLFRSSRIVTDRDGLSDPLHSAPDIGRAEQEGLRYGCELASTRTRPEPVAGRALAWREGGRRLGQRAPSAERQQGSEGRPGCAGLAILPRHHSAPSPLDDRLRVNSIIGCARP